MGATEEEEGQEGEGGADMAMGGRWTRVGEARTEEL